MKYDESCTIYFISNYKCSLKIRLKQMSDYVEYQTASYARKGCRILLNNDNHCTKKLFLGIKSKKKSEIQNVYDFNKV